MARREPAGIVLRENRYGVLGHLYRMALMNPERVAFTLHRVTGVLLVAYLVMHLYATSLTLDPKAWLEFVRATENPLVKFGEWVVASSLIFHGLNGIRLLFTEFLGVGIGRPRKGFVFPLTSPSVQAAQRRALYLVFALSAAGSVLAAYLIVLGGRLPW